MSIDIYCTPEEKEELEALEKKRDAALEKYNRLVTRCNEAFKEKNDKLQTLYDDSIKELEKYYSLKINEIKSLSKDIVTVGDEMPNKVDNLKKSMTSFIELVKKYE